jgi:hypothetical protein
MGIMSSIDLRVPSSLHKLALRSVAIHPGAIELRRTPEEASSRATAWVMSLTPAFAAE